MAKSRENHFLDLVEQTVIALAGLDEWKESNLFIEREERGTIPSLQIRIQFPRKHSPLKKVGVRKHVYKKAGK